MTPIKLVAFSGWFAVVTVVLGLFGPRRHPELWYTPDQQGDRLVRAGKFDEAAKIYADPLRRGVALYRSKDFKAAAAAFVQVPTADGSFNLGNSQVMLGKYDDAIKSYDRALTFRADWEEAIDNRALAVVRRDRMKTKGGDETGGQIAPDKIVFEKGKSPEGQTVQVNSGGPLSDEQLRTTWLRRVQTQPADFLRSKFAFQLSEQSRGQK